MERLNILPAKTLDMGVTRIELNRRKGEPTVSVCVRVRVRV